MPDEPQIRATVLTVTAVLSACTSHMFKIWAVLGNLRCWVMEAGWSEEVVSRALSQPGVLGVRRGFQGR